MGEHRVKSGGWAVAGFYGKKRRAPGVCLDPGIEGTDGDRRGAKQVTPETERLVSGILGGERKMKEKEGGEGVGEGRGRGERDWLKPLLVLSA